MKRPAEGYSGLPARRSEYPGGRRRRSRRPPANGTNRAFRVHDWLNSGPGKTVASSLLFSSQARPEFWPSESAMTISGWPSPLRSTIQLREDSPHGPRRPKGMRCSTHFVPPSWFSSHRSGSTISASPSPSRSPTPPGKNPEWISSCESTTFIVINVRGQSVFRPGSGGTFYQNKPSRSPSATISFRPSPSISAVTMSWISARMRESYRKRSNSRAAGLCGLRNQ